MALPEPCQPVAERLAGICPKIFHDQPAAVPPVPLDQSHDGQPRHASAPPQSSPCDLPEPEAIRRTACGRRSPWSPCACPGNLPRSCPSPHLPEASPRAQKPLTTSSLHHCTGARPHPVTTSSNPSSSPPPINKAPRALWPRHQPPASLSSSPGILALALTIRRHQPEPNLPRRPPPGIQAQKLPLALFLIPLAPTPLQDPSSSRALSSPKFSELGNPPMAATGGHRPAPSEPSPQEMITPRAAAPSRMRFHPSPSLPCPGIGPCEKSRRG